MTEEIRAGIIEDEETYAKAIANTLRDSGYTVAWVASSFEAAVKELNMVNYDILLVDINLNGVDSGIELGKMIHAYYKKPYIFVTSNTDPDSIKQAVVASPSAYLTKPFQHATLVATIQCAIHNFGNNVSPAPAVAPINDFFFVKVGDKYPMLNWANIVYLRSERNYTVIFNSTDRVEYMIKNSLNKTLRFIIPPHFQQSFLQVNRSEAVQLRHISELNSEGVKTNYGTFALTESYSNGLKKAMNVIM